MSAPLVVLQLVTTAAGLVVLARAAMVVNHMAHTERNGQPFWAWFGFGLGYVMLAAAAAGSVLACWSDQVHVGLSVWTVASAALIVCDRRRARSDGRQRLAA